MLEPYEGKLSRTVLRGLETGNGLRLLGEGLKKLGYKGKPNELMKHADTLEQYFKQNPPRSIGDAQDSIQRLTGIKRSPTQIRIFLKKIGMRCIKVGFVPGKAIEPEKISEQEQFKKDELEPRLSDAKSGKRSVFFC
jgi:hypothetical protein